MAQVSADKVRFAAAALHAEASEDDDDEPSGGDLFDVSNYQILPLSDEALLRFDIERQGRTSSR